MIEISCTFRFAFYHEVAIEFMTYTSRNKKDKSGAYLFLPAGPAKPHVGSDHRPIIRVASGFYSSEIQVLLPNLLHRYLSFLNLYVLDRVRH